MNSHDFKKFDEPKALLKKAQEGRNRVVHGAWSFRESKVYKLRSTARGKLKASASVVTADDLDAIMIDIHKAGVALFKVILIK